MSQNPKFVSLGNRRDKNLADVGDPKTALTNLLDGIAGEGTFVAEDLDALKGLRYEKITPGVLSELTDITIKVNDPENPSAPLVAAEPLVTIRDRVQKAKSISGEVPAYRGGLGLDARFINSEEIVSGNVNSTGADIFLFNEDQPIELNYWEYGWFEHGAQIDPTFKDQYGGIQWTGYFSPSIYDPSPTIVYQTSGLLIIEYDEFDTNVWTKVVNLYAKDRQVTPTSTTTGTTIPINPAHTNRVSVGDYLLSNPNISIIGVSGNSIELDGAITATINVPITFSKTLGGKLTTNGFILPPVEPGTFTKIRISYWYPDNNLTVEEKALYFSYTDSTLPFPYLYTQRALTPTVDEIRTFLVDSLSPYNTEFGSSGIDGANYRELNVGQLYINEYAPNGSFDVMRSAGPYTITHTANSTIVSSSGSLANVSIGNYIVPSTSTSTLPTKFQIKEKLSDTAFIVTPTPTTTGSTSVNFMEHKGFVEWMYATSVGATVTVPSTSMLQRNYLVMSSATAGFNRILTIPSLTTFTTSTNLGLAGTQPIVFYSDKGVTDNSKTVFCANVFGARVSALANLGATTLTLSSVVGITAGQVVQLEGSIPAGTTVLSILGNVITLSAPITKNIVSGATITLAPAGTDVNKEICVIPLDTAPPFSGTNDGLRTVNKGVRADPTLTSDFFVQTSNLIFVTASGAVTSASGAATFNRKIRLNNGQFYLLANTL